MIAVCPYCRKPVETNPHPGCCGETDSIQVGTYLEYVNMFLAYQALGRDRREAYSLANAQLDIEASPDVDDIRHALDYVYPDPATAGQLPDWPRD